MSRFSKSSNVFKEELETLKDSIKGEIKEFDTEEYPNFIGEIEGRKIYIVLNSPKLVRARTGASLLEYYIFVETSFELSLTRESFASRMGKKLGYEHEIEIGIKEFDDKFLIHGTPREKAKDFLCNESSVVEALGNFENFEIKKNYITVKYEVASETIFKSDKMLRVIKNLSTLAQGMKL